MGETVTIQIEDLIGSLLYSGANVERFITSIGGDAMREISHAWHSMNEYRNFMEISPSEWSKSDAFVFEQYGEWQVYLSFGGKLIEEKFKTAQEAINAYWSIGG